MWPSLGEDHQLQLYQIKCLFSLSFHTAENSGSNTIAFVGLPRVPSTTRHPRRARARGANSNEPSPGEWARIHRNRTQSEAHMPAQGRRGGFSGAFRHCGRCMLHPGLASPGAGRPAIKHCAPTQIANAAAGEPADTVHRVASTLSTRCECCGRAGLRSVLASFHLQREGQL